MKRILLTSTAIVGFAGAAAADVSWSGAATLGYNDDIKDGIYADVDLDVTLSQTLDNGLTASATFGWELEDDRIDGGNDFSADNNIVISLTSDMAGLYYGDTANAAETHWSGVTNMNEDGFSEADGENVLRGDMSFGDVDMSVSYYVNNEDGEDGELNQLALGASGNLGAATFSFAYQAEDDEFESASGDYNSDSILGVSVGTALGGADVKLAYAMNQTTDENSMGVEVSYPVGDVTVTAFYVAESAIDDSYGLAVAYASGPVSINAFYHDGGDEDSGIHFGYDVGNGLMVYAGWSDDDGQYIGGEYDLGGGASLTISYAEDEDNDENDEIGPQEYLHGTTVAMSMKF